MRPLHLLSNAVRAKTIVSVLVRYGFEDILEQLETPPGWLARLVSQKTEGLSTWQRIRRACEELGPTFVKIGQVLSTRPDVLPESLIEELRLLRDRVQAEPFEKIRPVLVEGLEGEPEELFTEWQPTPVASGSIAQIYRARLKSDGSQVGIKIQRPDIYNAILSDLDILAWLAQQVHLYVEALRPFDLPSVVHEIRTGLLRELDFRNEAHNAKLFNTINPYPTKVFAPRINDALSSRKVLVTEWVEGVSPTQGGFTQPERTLLAHNGGNSVFHQIIIAGFFHADPHSGNLLITPDLRIGFIDWGLVGYLTRQRRYFLADLFAAIVARDPEQVVNVATQLTTSYRRLDTVTLEKEVTRILHQHSDLQAGQAAIGRLIFDLLYLFGSNGIHVARDYTLLAKAVISIEETGKMLDPSFEIPTIARPYIEELSWQRWNPWTRARQTYGKLVASLSRLQQLPEDVQRLLRRVENEDIGINLYHKGLQEFQDTLHSITNRLVLAIIIAALLIGSSLVVTTEIRTFGLIGYCISGLLGLWIIVDIIRHGRHK